MTSKKKICVPSKRCGNIQKKVLTCLLAGVAIGLTRSPKKQLQVMKDLPKELQNIGPSVPRAIQRLYESKLVKKKVHADGSCTLVLSDTGKKRALTYDIESLRFPKQKRWDKQWRLVLYDIPESKREGRNTLRRTLQRAGMYEFQKSAFIYPYECKNEIDFVVELYGLQRYVRYMVVNEVDNEKHLLKDFDIEGE